MEYKLPPLPAHVGEESHGPSQQPVKLYDGEQMQAYAIAAIEAQASVVQQEPVAWYLPAEGGDDSMFRDHRTVLACKGNPWTGWVPLYTHPAQQAKPQPDPLHDDIQSVLFEVEQAIQNGCCPWQVEAAFEAYEAARRLQQPAHGIQGS